MLGQGVSTDLKALSLAPALSGPTSVTLERDEVCG